MVLQFLCQEENLTDMLNNVFLVNGIVPHERFDLSLILCSVE